jgi:superfamily II DNA or RNA helicase
MSNFKSIISKVNSWADFKNALKPLSKLEKGYAFEELTKYYLLSNPVYKDKLKNVWLQKEIPPSVTQKLNLPSNDQGIDLIAENNDGTFWAIQCKYLQDEEQRLSHRAISTFTSLSKLTAKNISYCLVATTADDYAKLYKGNNDIGFINADEWNKLNKAFFTNVRTVLSGKEIKYKPYKPKPHQQKALKEASEHFLKQKNIRGKLVFPCGAGKSLTGYWIKQALNAQSTIVAVPSLSLVKQTLEVYLRESVANKQKIEWLCVCSDEGIGKNDDVVVHTNEIGVPCITDKNFIANWIKENKKNKTVIFTTYQSGKTIAEAAKIAKAKFDLGIMDEAHKTVGNQDKLFSYLLFDKNIKIDKRIFMTATERRYAGSSENILSMDDVEVYGETFTQMPFKDAINQDILSDYKIITLFISDKEVKEIIEKNAFVKPQGKEWDKETEARTLASMVALRKAMVQLPIHHAVTFHSSIKKAEAFEQSQVVFSKAFPEFQNIDSFHVSGAMPTSQRSKIVNEFATSNKAIITNAKCLTEGVDVPNIDCVLFADPRKSTVDIVQAVGRALRKKEGKQFGYVILPVFTKSKTKEEIIESAEFKEILSTLRALASNDERIIEYFRDISKKGKSNSSNSGLVQFDIDEDIIESISEKDLINSLQLKTWDKLAKLSWMPFEEAREYVRGLKLTSISDFIRIFQSDYFPNDIPRLPNCVYAFSGWKNWSDWIGAEIIATNKIKFKDFVEAKSYVHKLKLKSVGSWNNIRDKIPNDIPSSPDRTYSGKGWISWGDWLGNSKISTLKSDFLNYYEAKSYVNKLNLKNQSEWRNYCKIGNKPINIPSGPVKIYKNSGWKNWGDWLGTCNVSKKGIKNMPFIEARKYVRALGFKNRDEWISFCKSGNKPKDIPLSAHIVYKNQGWVGMGDWLGTGNIAKKDILFLNYNKAKKVLFENDIKTRTAYNFFRKQSMPKYLLPAIPERTYKSEWKGWADFLGKEE